MLGGDQVVRVLVDPATPIRTGEVDADELPPSARSGLAAVPRRDAGGGVVVGMLYTAAVARGFGGRCRIRTCRGCARWTSARWWPTDWRASESVVAITRSRRSWSGRSRWTAGLQPVLGNNLTPPLTAVAAASQPGACWSPTSPGSGASAAATRPPGGRCWAAPSMPCRSTPADRGGAWSMAWSRGCRRRRPRARRQAG